MAPFDPVLWLHAFRGRRPRCHGVPLYEHPCTREEFAELPALLPKPPRARAGWMCFALFAAEWLRRHFDGGEWTYRGILCALGWPADTALDYDELEEAMAVGWGLEVLRSAAGREFFATLVLQAMPLRALLSERGALAQHVPRLVCAASEGASQQQLRAMLAANADTLPIAWRENAARELLVGIADYLRHTDLNKLQLADEHLRVALAHATSDVVATLGMRRSIVEREAGEFEWRARLVCPERIHERELLSVLGLSAPPSGSDMELFLQGHDGARIRIGEISPDPTRESYHIIHRTEFEPALPDGPLELLAVRGEQLLGPTRLPDRHPLEALPWVFVCKDDGEWQFIGQGDLATRSTLALVTLPRGANFDPRTIPRRVGMLGDRPLFECRSNVTILAGSLRWELRVGAERDVSLEYSLQGDRLDEPVVGRAVFRGMPMLVEQHEGRQRRIAASSLRWRPQPHAAWRTDLDAARGAIELCCMQHDVLCWQGRVRVVSPGFHISVSAIDESHCELQVVGLERGVDITLKTSHDVRMIQRGHWELSFTDDSPRIDLTLRWSEDTVLRFTCHLPRGTLGFELVDAGLLADKAELGFDELHLVRAFASGPQRARARLSIEARIGTATTASTLPLPERGPLELLRIRERLRTMLAANLCIEAGVSLTLDDGRTKRRVRVRRWARRIHCEDGHVTLSDRSGELGEARLVGVEVEARSFVDPYQRDVLDREGTGFALSRTRLTDDTLLLVARRGGRVWACPRACGRPVSTNGHDHNALFCEAKLGVHRPPHSFATLPDGLEAALRLPSKAERCVAIDGMLAILVGDHRHPDWRILDDYVAMLGDIHVSTFDVFERFLYQPAIAASLLLRARVHDFDRIWLALEELPFSWNLVAITDWLRAARGMLDAWQLDEAAPLELLVDHFERMRNLASRRSKAAPLVFSCILAALFARGDAHRQLATIELIIPTLLDDRERATQTLLRTVVEWPHAPTLSRLASWIESEPCELFQLVPQPPAGCGFRRPLLAAPSIAALLVIEPSTLAPGIAEHGLDVVQILTELRLLEAAHGDWFRDCFCLTLQLAAARCRHHLLPSENRHE